MVVIFAPFSNVTVASSMTGKSHYWRTLLSKSDTIFTPKVSKYYVFGHMNLKQYETLKQSLGEENVVIRSVRDLPGAVFPRNAFVWIDEFNSALAGLNAKEKARLISSLTSLYNESVHHLELYLVTNLQQIFNSDLFFLIGLSQSLALSTLSNDSLKVIQCARLGKDVINQADMLLRALRLASKPQFILIYHNASAMFPFIHSFMWTCLDMLPHFAIAVGQERTPIFGANSFFEVVNPGNRVKVTMASPEAKSALGEMAHLPAPLKTNTFALVPIASLLMDETGEGIEAPEQQTFDDLDRRVTDMLCEVCSLQELSAYKKLWYFIKHQPSLSICNDGLVLYCKGNQVNLLTLLKECLKHPPPVRPLGEATTRKRKKDEALTNCVPFVAELLGNSSFPAHLIRNTQLKALASKKNK